MLIFMTDKEKLQQLFNAALKDTSEVNKATPTRSVPASVPSPAPEATMPAAEAAPAPAVQRALKIEPLPSAAVLDDAASSEMGALLDEKNRRQSRRRKIEALVVAGVLLVGTGGTSAWFVQSPERMQALSEVVQDFRSLGDVKSIVAKYQKALDRVSSRSNQIDQATLAMGIESNPNDEEDPYFESEMKEMMGGEGRSVGQRNSNLQKNFAHMEKEHGALTTTSKPLDDKESFAW